MKKAARKTNKKKPAPRRGKKNAAPKAVRTAMRVVYPICCGIDVHRSQIVCTVATSRDGTLAADYLQRSFSTRYADLLECRDWLAECGCTDVCMESTGKYWVPVHNVLESTCDLVIANPKYTRAIRGKKTDSKDATWIADLSGLGMIVPSYVPPADIRAAREISRYRHELCRVRASERNRYQRCPAVSNATIAAVLSDVFGKTAQAVMERVVQGGDPPDEEECRKLAKGRAKSKAKEIAEAVEGCAPNETQKLKMRLSSGHVAEITKMMEEADAEPERLMEPHSQAVRIVASVPGFTEFSAMVLLAEIGTDMSQSESAKHLASWAGLTPRSSPGAGKAKSTRTTRAGTYPRPLLARCALGAIRCTTDDYFLRKYRRIKPRRGHKRAIIAISRMMPARTCHMLTNGEVSDPTDRTAEDRRDEERRAVRAAGDEQERMAIELLESRGYDVSLLGIPA